MLGGIVGALGLKVNYYGLGYTVVYAIIPNIMSESKEPQIKQVAPQDFLSEMCAPINLPEKFRLENEIKYAILSFKKWSEALATPAEVMAAVFLDGKNKIKVRDIDTGSDTLVKVKYADLTQIPSWQLALLLTKPSKEKEFLLIPENFSLPYPKTTNKVIEKGKKILGFMHVHINGTPPSPADLSNFLSAEGSEMLQGVISGDNFFVFLKTKETNGTVSKNEIEKKTDIYYKQTGNFEYSLIKVLTEECLAHKVGFYYGEIDKNIYLKLA